MSLSLKLLSKIDIVTKHTVNGWMREMEQELNIMVVPSILTAVVILFSRKDEIFDLGNQLSSNRKCVTCDNYSIGQRIYGFTRIPSKFNCKYQWDLKLKFNSDCDSIFIGIEPNNEMDHYYSTISYYYQIKYNSFRGRGIDIGHDKKEWKSIHISNKDNDMISLWLDLKTAKMGLALSGTRMKRADIKNIIKGEDGEYRFFVAICQINNSVEIVDFACN